MNTAIYARVSSQKQANEGTIDSQLHRIQEYAKEHGYSVDEDMLFVDAGVSGTTLVRPAWTDFEKKDFIAKLTA